MPRSHPSSALALALGSLSSAPSFAARGSCADSTGSHGLGGDVERLNKARTYEELLLRTLGHGAAAMPADLTGQADGGDAATGG